MAKNTKKTKVIVEKHIANNLEDALKKIQELSAEKKRNFVESVDLAINLGIDSKQTDQSVKGSVLLPHGSGKSVKVAVFTGDEAQQKEALEAIIKFYILRFPDIIIVGFNEIPAKADEDNPGFKVAEWLRELNIPEHNIFKR